MTSPESTLKAYYVSDDNEFCRLTFATTPGKAKVAALGEYGGDYIDLLASREKWLDRWESPEKIPAWYLLQGGWWFDCHGCGMAINYDNLCDENRSTDDVVGTYYGAIYCDAACKKATDVLKYKQEGAVATLKAHYEEKIRRRFGPDVVFTEKPHIYVDDGLNVVDVRMHIRLPFQDTRQCSAQSTWKTPLPMEQALETKLLLFVPNGDMEACKKYFYEVEGISIDAAASTL